MNLTKRMKEILFSLIEEDKVNFNRSYNDNADWYNCFGFALYIKGYTPNLGWLNSEDEAKPFLYENSVQVSEDKLQAGDIAVFYLREQLKHYAVLADPETMTFIHKPGQLSLRIETKDQIYNRHSNYGDIVEYRR